MRFYKKHKLYAVIFLTLMTIQASQCFGQTIKIDSLRNAFHKEKIDSLKLDAGIALLDAKSDNYPKEALSFADSLLQMESLNNLPLRYARTMILKIQILTRISEYKSVIALGKQLEPVVSENNFRFIELKLRNEIGLAYYYQAIYTKASEEQAKAFEIAKELNNVPAQLIALTNLSTTFLAIKNYPEVEKILSKALKIAKEEKNALNIGMVLTNLGNLENERKDFKSAKTYFEEALVIFKQISMKYGEALVLNNLGFTEFQIRNYDAALAYFNQSEAIRKEIGEQFGLLSIYVKKGDVFKELANWPEALKYFELAIQLAKKINNPEKLEDAYEGLVQVYERSGDFDAALKTHKRLSVLKDSLYAVNLQSALEQDKIAIDNSFYEDKISELENKQSTLKKNIYFVLTILLIVILIFTVLWYHHNRKHKIQLKQLNAILSSNSEEQNKLTILTELKESLKKGVLDGEYWLKFGLIFDEVHPNFSKKLKETFPNLTKSELRICCLIRLGLHNHDLVQCLNITPKSIRNAKYRIYKKMDLESTQDLSGYLMSI